MKKTKKVSQVVATSAIITAAFVAAGPQVEAASNVQSAVAEAHVSANKLVKFYDVRNQQKVTISTDFSTAYAKASEDIKKAEKAVQQLKDGSEKKNLTAQLNVAKDKLLKAARIIDAIKTGQDLQTLQETLNGLVEADTLNTELVDAYHALSLQMSKAERVFSKVYGEGNRQVIRDAFLVDAKIAKETVIYEVSMHTLQNQIDQLLVDNKIDEAKAAYEKLNRLETRAVKIKEAGNKLHPGKYPDLPEMAKKAKERKDKIKENLPFELSLMHTNDTHAHIENIAKFVTAVNEVREENPEALLLNAGDVFSGTLYFNEFKGQADLEFMNLVKYDLMTFGNHEFDLGSSPEGHKALADFVKGAEFPFVSTNVDFSADENMKNLFHDEITEEPANGQAYSGVIKEVNGEKVGFFGLTTEETATLSSPGSVVFEDYIAEAEKAVAAFEAEGINKIVAITHIGYDDNVEYDNDLELAKMVDGIDIIVGGHSHTKLDTGTVVNKDEAGVEKDPTLIVQASQYGEYLGTVDVEFNNEGIITNEAAQLIKVADKVENAEAAELLKKYSDQIATIRDTSTGATAAKELANPRTTAEDPTAPSVRNSETELGNLITDGMLAKAKQFKPNTVIAMQNSGGIRASIDAGEITLGDVLTVLPFGNTLATMNLTGAEILTALEHSVGQAPNESGGFLHVSGMKFTYDSSKPKGERVVTVEVEETEGNFVQLDPAKEYAIATNAFTAKGGDGYTVFADAYAAGRVTDLGLSDWENLRDYVANLVTVEPVIEGRIVDVAE
ncbi:5'-nucleotidase C-terminal domain-containing protein [Metabacillus sp. B2-18]|uniref:5'-nucleotidase C-terminal domain-containing protein n=1 Tax=Metabacillus sp. B2-18 TaxID=2897333 RepID=UPI001E61FED0|nr:5'-nucleotidase C-terminal domain-containing protein [Metabacillus sp. B2-18]UGB30495.1 5'-nucleotidase C-terminal domain-containing protein [Metabacillus sp. B2-18]